MNVEPQVSRKLKNSEHKPVVCVCVCVCVMEADIQWYKKLKNIENFLVISHECWQLGSQEAQEFWTDTSHGSWSAGIYKDQKFSIMYQLYVPLCLTRMVTESSRILNTYQLCICVCFLEHDLQWEKTSKILNRYRLWAHEEWTAGSQKAQGYWINTRVVFVCHESWSARI